MQPFTKYPKTFHLPWSPGMTKGDKVIKDLSVLRSAPEIVATCKMDGENTSIYRDHYHAKSLDSADHPSRHFAKGLWATLRHDIPEGWRICGENLYAKHFIGYDNLPGFFLVFSVWDHHNMCLPWDDTVEWADLLGLPTVATMYRGNFDQQVLEDMWKDYSEDETEGYVVRVSSSFHYKDFHTNVAKYVRRGHVQTDEHWMHKQIIPNQLKPCPS